MVLEVVDQGADDAVGQTSLQAAQRTLAAVAGGELLRLVGGAGRVVPLVSERANVERGVEPAVPGP